MRRIAIVCGPALGHVVRTYRIASCLRELAELDITFVSPRNSARLERLCGDAFTVLNLRTDLLDPMPGYAAMAARLDDFFAEQSFDALVHDMCPLQWLSAVRFPDCPRINITNGFLTATARADTFQTRRFSREGAVVNELRASRGLAPVANAHALYEADLVLLADPFALASQYGELPPNHKVSGSIALPPESGLPDELAGLDSVLLVSMGSTGRAEIPSGMIAAVKQATQSESVVLVGESSVLPVSDPVIDHTFGWLPIDALLDRTRAVITHGGTGSTYQALMRGKPVYVYPTHRNQALLGECLESLGAGCLLDASNWRDKVIGQDFSAMSRRADDFGRAEAKVDGAVNAAQAIADLVNGF